MSDSPVLLHVWNVHPDEEPALVTQLSEMLGQASGDPAFVSARILTSPDRTSVAALVEMRSPEDRRRLEELPVVRETLHRVHGAYNLVTRLYQQAGAYGAA